jgi:glycosyltransferase involved in cell wall biosynthesis
MGPALGTILRRVAKNNKTKIICIADNVIPHERRPGDLTFTRYFLKACDGFVTMSEKVYKDLKKYVQLKPVRLVQHPIYDTFGNPVSKEEARNHLNLDNKDKILLFFGFIRQYKGLDLLIKAMADERIRKLQIKLLVAGEFYEDNKPYLQLIKENNLDNHIILRTEFIPDSEVRYYFCAADGVVQPYKNATQSGVTPLAYHFEKPMIVTNVGGLPAMVPDGKVGIICKPEPSSLSEAIINFYQLGEDYFIPHLREEKQKYAWSNLTNAIYDLAKLVKSKH